MMALSVRAPWWWAILHLGKDVENRDWRTYLRTRIWLHASKWFDEEDILWDFDEVRRMRTLADPLMIPPPVTLRHLRDYRGCLVGACDIVDCVSASRSPWFVGPYGFVLANVKPLAKPVPFKGALGFFHVPDGLADEEAA
jgi:hypothetical protein